MLSLRFAMLRHLSNASLWAIALAYLLYIIFRVWYIPMTQDEVATCYNHVPRTVWDILTYSSDTVPNNHILNTLCIKALTGLFGMSHLVARLPVVILGGVLYLVAALLLVRRMGSHPLLQLFGYLVLIGNPFMAEFFGLARGYGMSIGLMMMSVFFSWRFLEQRRLTSLRPAVLFAGLAVLANFTLLNVYFPWFLLMAIVVWQGRSAGSDFRREARELGLGLLFMVVLCALPIYRMQADDQLSFWGSSGFFQETIFPLVRYSTMGHPYLDAYTQPVLVALATAFSVGGWAVALWQWRRQSGRIGADPLLFAGFLFAGTIAFNLLQATLLHVPFLNPRTAVFLYPLFALQLFATGVLLWRRVRWRTLLFVLPLGIFTVANFENNRNLKRSFEWSYDRGTFEVLNFLKQLQEKEGRSEPYSLDSNWLLQNSLNFHLDFGYPPYGKWVRMVPYHDRQPPKGNTEFFYTAEPEDIRALEAEYEPVMTVETERYVLMRRKTPL